MEVAEEAAEEEVLVEEACVELAFEVLGALELDDCFVLVLPGPGSIRGFRDAPEVEAAELLVLRPS